MRVLVTRPDREASRTAAQLVALGHEPLLAPLTKIIALRPPIPDSPFDAIAVTSAQALHETCLSDLPDSLRALPAYVVGMRTSEAAARAGLTRIGAVAANAAELSGKIREALSPEARILYLAGRDRKPELETKLASAGFQVSPLEVYEARAVEQLPDVALDSLRDGRFDAVLHFSRRNAAIFVELARQAGVEAEAARAQHCAISSDAAAPLRGFADRVKIADSPNAQALYETID